GLCLFVSANNDTKWLRRKEGRREEAGRRHLSPFHVWVLWSAFRDPNQHFGLMCTPSEAASRALAAVGQVVSSAIISSISRIGLSCLNPCNLVSHTSQS